MNNHFFNCLRVSQLRGKTIWTKFISTIGLAALLINAPAAHAQQAAAAQGILELAVELLKSIDTKLDKLIAAPPPVIPSIKRAAVFVQVRNQQCPGPLSQCNAVATKYCQGWGYPKGEATVYAEGSPFASMTGIICFD